VTNCSSIYNVFPNNQTCFDECIKYPGSSTCSTGFEGAGLCATGNSFGCRQYHLLVAVNVTANLQVHCSHATPASAGTTDPAAVTPYPYLMGPCTTAANASEGILTQNGLLDDYCNQIISTCPGYLTTILAWCLSASQFLPMPTDISAYPNTTGGIQFPISSPPSPGNTFSLACKRYHAQAARADPVTHCPHATTGYGACGSDCEYFCALVMGTCTGANQAYTNSTICMSQCATLPVSVTRDPIPTSGNTVSCRTYHAMVASTSAANALIHCPHTTFMSTGATCGASGGSAAGLSASLVMVGILSMLALAW